MSHLSNEMPRYQRELSYDDSKGLGDDKLSPTAEVPGLHKDGQEYEVTVREVDAAFAALVAEEADHDIKLRTMSWQKTALLLLGDQVCLAIMAQAWSFKVLGWVPGLITTFLAGVFFWVTSYTLWRFMVSKGNKWRATNLSDSHCPVDEISWLP